MRRYTVCHHYVCNLLFQVMLFQKRPDWLTDVRRKLLWADMSVVVQLRTRTIGKPTTPFRINVYDVSSWNPSCSYIMTSHKLTSANTISSAFGHSRIINHN